MENRIIYKYSGLTYYEDILNGKLYLSRPDQFNDPYDSHIEYVAEGTTKELIEYLNENCEDKIRRKELRDQIQKTKKLFDPSFHYETNKILRICCFTLNNDNILMWSHYAEKHFGVCFGFMVRDENECYWLKLTENTLDEYKEEKMQTENHIPIQKVLYRSERPKPLNIYKKEDKLYEEYVIQKYKDWEYEKEYRIVIAHENFPYDMKIDYDLTSLKEVYLGMKMEEETKNKIINKLKEIQKEERWIDLYQCKREMCSFKIIQEKMEY